MIQGIAVSLFVLVLPVLGNRDFLRAPQPWIIVALAVLASVLQPGYNPFTITRKPKDRGTGAQIIWSVYLTQLAAIIEAAYWRYPQSVNWDAAAVVCLAVAVLGLAFRTWAVLTLGNLFSMHIDIQDGHSIIQHGPFRIVRHPSYLGAFLMYVPIIAFLHSWFSLAVAAVALPVAFARRIHYEEELLRAEFGEQYAHYSRNVKRIIPWVW